MAVKHLIIGGGAVDEELASALASFPNAVWSTYGMTETLSHIALRRLNGPEASDWYTPFRGVTLSQTDEGCLVIDAPAVHDGALVTNDIVEFNTTPGVSSPPYREGVPFRILGRKDNVICSGGVKILAEEVERLLRARLREPYLISKRPDPKFGEAVVLLTTSTDVEAVRTVCQKVLPKYWQPRFIVHVNQIPLTETGKPARKEAERLAVL
jgi:O-succinylbenzoic acid--CoA ligase